MGARTFVADVNKDGLSWCEWCLPVQRPNSAVFMYKLCFPVLIDNLVGLVNPEIPSVDASGSEYRLRQFCVCVKPCDAMLCHTCWSHPLPCNRCVSSAAGSIFAAGSVFARPASRYLPQVLVIMEGRPKNAQFHIVKRNIYVQRTPHEQKVWPLSSLLAGLNGALILSVVRFESPSKSH